MTHVPENGRGTAANTRLIDACVADATGCRATIVSTEETQGGTQACIELGGGARVLVPVSMLTLQADGSYRLPFTFTVSPADTGSPIAQQVRTSFPVMKEEMQVSKRVVDTGRGVRIRKTVSEREQTWDEALFREELEVEHVPIDQVVAQAPSMRYEGDTLVLPVLEEVLVVQKQLRLKEEVRVTRRRHQVRQPQSILLRSEQITAERFDEGRK
ncbi:MAG TPA: YsnF/AvaK domain-containing protein [Noviherbaspirillum sp.]